MANQIFVNLPVKDLNKTMDFFKSLGFSFNPQFTNDDAGCMVVSDSIYFMMVTEPFFKQFTGKPIANAFSSTETINVLSFNSRDEVDELLAKAVAAGAKEPRDPQDYGWMYNRAFEDPDGHLWEFMYADITQAPQM